MRTLIKNGTVVTSDMLVQANVTVEGDTVVTVVPTAAGSSAPDADYDRIIDAEGCLVFPGFIDTHTHFDLVTGDGVRTADDFVSGSRAALLGGTTCVLDFATQSTGGTLGSALDEWHAKAEGSYCNYGFHMAIADWNEATAAEIPVMVERGVTSFKLYMVYDGLYKTDGEIYLALKDISCHGGLCGVHCENRSIIDTLIGEMSDDERTLPISHAKSRPSCVEAEAVARLMRIAQLAQSPCWVVHLSTRDGLEEVRRARSRGQRVYVETCPQYLLLTDDCYARQNGLKYVMSPPLRKAEDCRALRKAVAAGAVDFIGTDHCSFNYCDKRLGEKDFTRTPNGGVGVGDRARLIYTYCVADGSGRITPIDMARLLSYNAAAAFGMKGYGTIAAGSHADIVVWDPAYEDTLTDTNHFHRCDNTPFEGMTVKGRARDVLLNGNLAVQNGEIVGGAQGRFVPRAAAKRW